MLNLAGKWEYIGGEIVRLGVTSVATTVIFGTKIRHRPGNLLESIDKGWNKYQQNWTDQKNLFGLVFLEYD